MLNIANIRAQFPALHQEVHGHPLVYLDNGATTQKPQVVIDAIQQYYAEQNSNIHRGVHYLSQLATDAYEASRTCIQKHLNAKHTHEIIFTRGITEAINLVAHGFALYLIQTTRSLYLLWSTTLTLCLGKWLVMQRVLNYKSSLWMKMEF